MKSRLQIAGHPIHAMVVGYPIALYTTALLCDVLYIALGDAFWFRVAFWAIAFGVVTHVTAAVTGMPDFLAVARGGPEHKEARRAANSHLVFGLALLVVQALNLGVRNVGVVPPTGSVGLPVAVNVIAVAVLGIQGWYGGELVYRHQIGVPQQDLPEAQGKHHKAKRHG